MKTTYDVIRHSDGVLQSSSIGLHYPVRARNSMVSDRLSIKCTSKIGDAYWQSVVEETTLKRLGRMLESRSAAATLSTSEFSVVFVLKWWPWAFSRFARGSEMTRSALAGTNYCPRLSLAYITTTFVSICFFLATPATPSIFYGY